MKKFCSFALGVLIVLSPLSAFAGNGRQIGTPTNPDAVSWYGGGCDQIAGGNGISGCEVAIDYFGNIVPTVTSAQTLGASSLQWSNIYSVSESISGNETAGTVGTWNSTLGTGNLTAPTQLTVVGGIVLQNAQVGVAGFGITKSTTIPYLGTYEQLLSTGAIVMTSVPTISTVPFAGAATGFPTGTELVLTSTSSVSITLQSNGTLAGSLLRLGAGTRVIAQGDTLTLLFNSTVGQWIEQSYTAGSGN